MSGHVVVVSGSPSPTSRSSLVARELAAHAERAGIAPVFRSVGDFDPADLIFGRASAPALADFVEQVRTAAAIVLATPVYKAVYAGGLKALVDVVPPDALTGRPALGIATARAAAHHPTVDAAFQSLFAFFGARGQRTLFLTDAEIQVEGASGTLSSAAADAVARSAHALVAAVRGS